MAARSVFTILLSFLLACQPSQTANDEDRFEKFEPDSLELPDQAYTLGESDDYDDPERSEWQNPDLVINKLGNLDEKTVADIGAGTGYFSFRLAQAGAYVIAIDIESEFLKSIDRRLQESIQNPTDYPVETRLSETNDPLLQDEEADVALLVNTYTYLNNRIDYLKKVRSGLASDGLIAIVDYTSASNPVINDGVNILDPEIVRAELEQAGFSDVVIDRNSLQYQYIITAKK